MAGGAMGGFGFLECLLGGNPLFAQAAFAVESLMGEDSLGHGLGDAGRPEARHGLMRFDMLAQVCRNLLDDTIHGGNNLGEAVLVEAQLSVAIDALCCRAELGFPYCYSGAAGGIHAGEADFQSSACRGAGQGFGAADPAFDLRDTVFFTHENRFG